jgi:Flp pilus assembly protein CpaB
MKWGIIILVILGLAAAACAAILVSTLGAKSAASADKNSSPGIEVAMAKTSLPAMTVITLEHIVKETVPKEEVPKEGFTSPASVIGRVLSMPVVEGQILTESCFVTAGSGAQLAAALDPGMRMVTVALSSKTTPDIALLYPGCVVDVLVSFRLSSRDSEGEAVCMPMLHGIQVLAVDGESVVSNPKQETEEGTAPKPRRTSRGGATMVTLMVNSKQAEALQLAADNGIVSLAIRNPLDSYPVDRQPTILSQGRLAHSGSPLTPVVPFNDEKSLEKFLEQLRGKKSSEPNDPNSPLPQPKLPEEYRAPKPQNWDVTVIRGQQKTVEEMEMPQTEGIGGSLIKK